MSVHYRRATTVVWRESRGNVLVRPVAVDEITVLSGPGVDLWHLLVDEKTLDELADELAETYAVQSGQVSGDIRPVLDDLVTRGIVDRTVAA